MLQCYTKYASGRGQTELKVRDTKGGFQKKEGNFPKPWGGPIYRYRKYYRDQSDLAVVKIAEI